MKRVEYKFDENIFDENTLFNQQKLCISNKNLYNNITEHFKSKQQKSFISLNTLTTSLIFQTFSSSLPAPILFQLCHPFLLF